MVDYLLHVYSSRQRKDRITPEEWRLVNKSLILAHLEFTKEGGNPADLDTAHSNHDEKSGCGIIACRTRTGANWFKNQIDLIRGQEDTRFRAWERGEHPSVTLCRVFLPSPRLEDIPNQEVIPLIRTYNPGLPKGNFTLKREEGATGGRALLVEIDNESYSTIRNSRYKLKFMMGDIDCYGIKIPPPPLKRSAPSKSSYTPRTGDKAILPAHAAEEFKKLSSRDPRLNKNLNPIPDLTSKETPKEDGYSTTSSRGSEKYKPPQRHSRRKSRGRRSTSESSSESSDSDDSSTAKKHKHSRSSKSKSSSNRKLSPINEESSSRSKSKSKKNKKY